MVYFTVWIARGFNTRLRANSYAGDILSALQEVVSLCGNQEVTFLITAKNVEERRCKFFNFSYVIAVKSFRNTKICFNRIAGNANEFAFL